MMIALEELPKQQQRLLIIMSWWGTQKGQKQDSKNMFSCSKSQFVFKLTFDSGNGTRHQLVEDVVGSFQRLLGDDTSLFEQVWVDGHWLVSWFLKGTNLQDSISAPESLPMGPKWIRINLPNRDELSLRVVFALPKASRTGLVWTIWSSRFPFLVSSAVGFLETQATQAKYAITFFVFSVFPAPDSPLIVVTKLKWLILLELYLTYVMSIDWFSRSVRLKRCQWKCKKERKNVSVKMCPLFCCCCASLFQNCN